MTPEQYSKLQETFLELRSLDPAVRVSKLSSLRLADPVMADEVQNLLSVDNTDAFMDQPLVDRDQRVPIETQDMRPSNDGDINVDRSKDAHPTQIGPWRILQKIGEGGHGIVFMAEQLEPIRRKVAIKWIKKGMDSDMILARFEAEWQALAMMKHPSIANVIEAGSTETGQPYFVMELVHGIPIDEFCETNRLDLTERLTLFQQVCSAVHHAHQKGIIHRDIKPANVLITTDSGTPLAKVIDFGIAKAVHMPLTDKTMFTEYGQIVGTLEYMSPEQALMSQSGIDVRSDVYSLGVLLYLLLTGQTPVSRKELLRDGIWELKNVLQTLTPKSPSTRITTGKNSTRWRDYAGGESGWVKHVRGDLDWITMKAIARETDARYGTAAEFSEDIERYLKGEAVRARPPGKWYSLQKFVRRNRVATAAGTAIVASLIASVLALSWGYWQSQKNLDIAVKAQRQADEKSFELASALAAKAAFAGELAKTLNRQTIESAWKKAAKGDFDDAVRKLDTIAESDRNETWRQVRQLASQYRVPTFRTNTATNVRVFAIDEYGHRVAIINTESQLEIWDAATLQPMHQIELPTGIYSSLAFSGSDSILVGGSKDEVIRVNLNDETLAQPLRLKSGAIRKITFDKKNNAWWCITGANYIYRLSEPELKVGTSVKLNQRLASISAADNGQHVAVGTIDGDLFAIPTTDPERYRRIKGFGRRIESVQVDQENLVAIDASGATGYFELNELFEAKPGVTKRLAPISKPATPPVSVALDKQKSTFVALRDGTIVWIDEKNSVPLKIFPSPCRSIHFSQSLSRLFVVHADGSMSVLDRHEISRRKQIASLPENLSDGIADLDSGMAITSYRNGTIKRWNNATGAVTSSVELHGKEALELDINSNETKLASVGLDKKLIICNLPALETALSMDIAWGVRCPAFSPDGKVLAGPADAAQKTDLREGTFDLWDLESGKMIRRFAGHKNWVTRFQFLSEGGQLASLSVDGTVRVWNTSSAECIQTFDFSGFGNAFCFAVDEKSGNVAIGHSDGVVSCWNIESGELLSSSIAGDAAVIGLRSLDSGDWIVFVNGDNSIKFLDQDFQPIVSLNACVGPISASRTSGDALMLVGQSGLVRILKVD